MIAYEIITGKVPFYELNDLTQFKFIQKIIGGYRPKFTEFVTEKMRNLLTRCWSENPEERPTFDEIFEELSSEVNFYFSENVDNEEIQNYLEILVNNKKEK